MDKCDLGLANQAPTQDPELGAYEPKKDFLGESVVKNPPANSGDTGLIPGLGRSPGGGNGNPLQYSCWDNPTDRGAWWATVHRVTKSWTRLKRLSAHTQEETGESLLLSIA